MLPDKREFISGVLVPCSDAYEVVTTRVDYQAATHAEEVNGLLRQLNLLDNTDWIPPAISWLTRHGVDGEATLTFLRDLDRLAASMHVRRLDITQRIERYGRVLRWIESGAEAAPGTASGLELSDDERRQTLEVLDGDVYPIVRLRLYVMLRLDEALTSGGVVHDSPTISVEHVLPQNPPADSPWLTSFSPHERAEWTHRLANLVLLTRRKNSAAGNQPFEQKKTGYFTGRLGTSPFAVTAQVLHETEWTPAVLARRQALVMQKLQALWRL